MAGAASGGLKLQCIATVTFLYWFFICIIPNIHEISSKSTFIKTEELYKTTQLNIGYRNYKIIIQNTDEEKELQCTASSKLLLLISFITPRGSKAVQTYTIKTQNTQNIIQN